MDWERSDVDEAALDVERLDLAIALSDEGRADSLNITLERGRNGRREGGEVVERLRRRDGLGHVLASPGGGSAISNALQAPSTTIQFSLH